MLGETSTIIGYHPPDIFDTKEEGRSGEENVVEEPEEETGEEEEEKERRSSSEEEDKVDDDKPDYDLWDPIRNQLGEDLKESCTERILDRGKSKEYSENAPLNSL